MPACCRSVVQAGCDLTSACMFRDVSSVELLMNNHQGIKAEIDARNDSFTACIELGKALLARKHYASEEVRRDTIRRTVMSLMFLIKINICFCSDQREITTAD